ncbi:substrate-binding domain-containing protein [Olivibacter sp. SDN3]|uniref:PstS family phosphate ABC transporter substrate-binding protein n=1 Tax=Olivibacter sp. SDN3 TaxID=2764720 RepID=UPI001651257E|nr:substrate-binding domain-containing protein [Olivibacter sp. SDN3]QNL51377.1 substrate-binding domain-containing protein [Olivibacter sp. SDN3]
MNKQLAVFLSLISFIVVFVSCNDAPSKDKVGILMGRAKVLVDETIAPIVEDQLNVFQSSYTNTELTMVSMPENQVINYLLRDSAQIAVTSRALTEQEIEFFKKKKIYPKMVKFATDAIAVITHKNNTDSTITVDEIVRLMKGNDIAGVRTMVFDNSNSSTVDYFRQLAGVEKLPEQGVYAMKTSADILRYVNENPQSVGVIGVNWIVQPPNDLIDYVNNVKLMGVRNQKGKPGDDAYYKPTQTNLALNLYPFTRTLYCINVQGKKAVGMGFSAFLHGERGQRLILKAGLLPDSIPSREIIIRK